MAHGKKHDYNKVLRPAFQRVDNFKVLPKPERWRCTIDLADRLPKCEIKLLDEVLEHCGFERREEDALHDALDDAQLAAKVYMYLIKQPEPYKSHLGFCKE